MKQILLIDREFGAGGTRMGEKFAARLNWQLFDDNTKSGLKLHFSEQTRPADCQSAIQQTKLSALPASWLTVLINSAVTNCNWHKLSEEVTNT